MSGLIKRKKAEEDSSDKITDISTKPRLIYAPVPTDKLVSTGSTLLDLAISGGRARGGGIPSGIMVELYGPSSSGKSTLLVEIGASIQNKGGSVFVADPEARLDQNYAEMHGMKLPADNYIRPDTVSELFQSIMDWKPENKDTINLFAADSIAALSTDAEMGEGDKRGQRKAKELSEGCRKTARLIAEDNKLVIFTNQERQSEFGKTTPGGFAVGYHSSIRARVARVEKLEKEKTHSTGVKTKKVIGIHSEVTITKSSVDDEYRKAPIFIIFGFGIDDIRANLQWLKDMNKGTKYVCPDGKDFTRLESAIQYVEDNSLESPLRESVIDLWEEIESAFKMNRKKKVRW